MDLWAGEHPDVGIFMQTGETTYRPRFCAFEAFTGHEQWEQLFQDAGRVISHAGMGTILKSLDYGKPLIIVPRLAALGEHRNDHQVATAKRFEGFGNITVVSDTERLAGVLDQPVSTDSTVGSGGNKNLEALIAEIRRFVQN